MIALRTSLAAFAFFAARQRACLDVLVTYNVQQHLAEVIVFGLAIRFGCIDTVVYWIEVCPIRMREINHANPPYCIGF